MAHNDNRFFAYELGNHADMPITTAPVARDWMDKTDKHFAYRCLPLVIANQAGWLIHNPTTFEATWDGGTSVDNVRINFDCDASGEEVTRTPRLDTLFVTFNVPSPRPRRDPRISSHFGSGVVTFAMPYLFRTPLSVNLWVKGPANSFKDGAQALEGVVETDWGPATFTMNWKLNRPNHPVLFAKGEPICMLVPVPRGFSENLVPLRTPLRNEPALYQQYRNWRHSRDRYNFRLLQAHPNAVQQGWQRDYFKGQTPDGSHADGHQTRLELKEFTELTPNREVATVASPGQESQ